MNAMNIYPCLLTGQARDSHWTVPGLDAHEAASSAHRVSVWMPCSESPITHADKQKKQYYSAALYAASTIRSIQTSGVAIVRGF